MIKYDIILSKGGAMAGILNIQLNPVLSDKEKNLLSVNKYIEQFADKNLDLVVLPEFSCHHLRHTFCTRLCEHETNLKVIQDIMGHRNIETTMDIYAEATDQKKQESFNNLSKLDIF